MMRFGDPPLLTAAAASASPVDMVAVERSGETSWVSSVSGYRFTFDEAVGNDIAAGIVNLLVRPAVLYLCCCCNPAILAALL